MPRCGTLCRCCLHALPSPTTVPLLYAVPTYAAAQNALVAGDLPDGARVEVERDETQTPVGRRYRYDVVVEPPPSIASPELLNPEPFATLDREGRLVELLSPGSAGVIDSADYDSFADAVAAVNADPTMFGLRLRAGVHLVPNASSLVLREGVELLFDPGAEIDVSGHTAQIVIQGPIRASRRRLFRFAEVDPLLPPTQWVVFRSGGWTPLLVEWFGVRPSIPAADNDSAMARLLACARVELLHNENLRDSWLPISFGFGQYEFSQPIHFGLCAVSGVGHLVTNRRKRGNGYNQPFGGTVLRFRSGQTTEALRFGGGDGATPARASGFAVVGPNQGAAIGIRLERCIEASFVDVCVANFGTGVVVTNAQGCVLDRFNVWGCDIGLRLDVLPGDPDALANSNTLSNFNFNACNVAVQTDDLTATGAQKVPLPPGRTSQWRFLGGTIQGGDLDPPSGPPITFAGGVWLGPRSHGFVFVGVWFEVAIHPTAADAIGVRLDGGTVHTFVGCRFSQGMRGIEVKGNAGVGGHAFRDGYAPGGDPLPLTIAAGTVPVVVDNVQRFDVQDASGLARVVGGYDPIDNPTEVDRAPARLGLDQDAGRIPWTQSASAPLQFTSVKPHTEADDAQMLIRVSERDEVPGGQVTRWSLRTAGSLRQIVRIYNALGDAAFEFDTVTPHAITEADDNTVNTGDPTTDVVIENMRTRIEDLEDILRAIVKTIPPP